MQKHCLTLLLTILIHPLIGAGLAVHPMEQFVKDARPAHYLASNGGDRAIAVEVTVESWTIDEEGKELSEESDDLVAFPAQFILKGHSSKKVKVTPRERKVPRQEKTYRVTLKELPISFEEEAQSNQVYMANAYRTSYYLLPDKPKQTLESVEAQLDGRELSFRLRNSGNSHLHLTAAELSLRYSGGREIRIDDPQRLAGIAGQNLHAGMTRLFQLELDEEEAKELESMRLFSKTPIGRDREPLEIRW